MLNELRERLLALGYEFEELAETETPDEGEASEETETPEESATPEEPETPALRLALRRALAFVRGFCNRLDWPQEDFVEWPDNWPVEWRFELREAVLDLAAAYFLQAKMALTPETLAVTPTLTSLRMGDAAWGFGGGTQKSGTDALSRTEALAGSLLCEAKAALCAWRSL